MIAEALGVRGPTISANGALVVDMPAIRLVRDIRIEGVLAVALIAELTAAIPSFLPGSAASNGAVTRRGRSLL